LVQLAKERMALAHTSSIAAVRGELAEAEGDEQALQEDLQKAQRETAEAHGAGSALLSAVEAAMAPLMRELAVTRRALGSVDIATAFSFNGDPDGSGSGGGGFGISSGHGLDGNDAGGDPSAAATANSVMTSLGAPVAALAAAAAAAALLGSSSAGLGEEIRHLELDIGHLRERAERLQAEDRRRGHEVKRLREELQDAADDLSYERQRACRYAGRDHPAFEERHGRRLEIHAETSLRESAEQRAGKLARDVTKLSMDTCMQQTTIEQLGRRLDHVRRTAGDKDCRLAEAVRATSALHKKIRGESPCDDGSGEGQKLGHRKRKGSASTGKLPHLSF